MDIKDFIAGQWKAGYQYKYFSPTLINHEFYWTEPKINHLLEQSALKLGELNALAYIVPNVDVFIKMHLLKEAVLSSRIEGTQTHIAEALQDKREIEPERRDDWQEVNNYVNAINFAIEQLNNLPLSNRLLRQTHSVLLTQVRGETKTPGEFRNSQNWIGGTSLKDAVFIPPIHHEVVELMSDLEKFLNNESLFSIQRKPSCLSILLIFLTKLCNKQEFWHNKNRCLSINFLHLSSQKMLRNGWIVR